MKHISILGPGCPKCELLYKHCMEAVQESGIDCEVIKIKDIQEIMKHGVMMTPGFVIDGTVASVGKVLSVAQIKDLITKA